MHPIGLVNDTRARVADLLDRGRFEEAYQAALKVLRWIVVQCRDVGGRLDQQQAQLESLGGELATELLSWLSSVRAKPVYSADEIRGVMQPCVTAAVSEGLKPEDIIVRLKARMVDEHADRAAMSTVTAVARALGRRGPALPAAVGPAAKDYA